MSVLAMLMFLFFHERAALTVACNTYSLNLADCVTYWQPLMCVLRMFSTHNILGTAPP